MMLQPISQLYRRACREIVLDPEQKVLFMRLLREISVNAAKSRKAWTMKEDFITLWWMSIGRFPTLMAPQTGGVVIAWVNQHLPFELSESERRLLVN